MAAEQNMENLFDNMPADCVAEVMSKLSFASATNFRKACTFMDSVFTENRIHIEGPECDMYMDVTNDNEFEIRIRSPLSEDEQPREIPEEKWDSYLVNFVCKNLYINMNGYSISEELIREVFASWNLNNVHVKGARIEESKLRLFEELRAKNLIVNVDDFLCNGVETTKITNLIVKNRIHNLYEIIKKNRELTEIKVSIEWSKLGEIVPLVKKAKWKQTNIVSWEIDVYNIPEDQPTQTRHQLERFAMAMFKISTVDVGCVVEDFEDAYITIVIDKIEHYDEPDKKKCFGTSILKKIRKVLGLGPR